MNIRNLWRNFVMKGIKKKTNPHLPEPYRKGDLILVQSKGRIYEVKIIKVAPSGDYIKIKEDNSTTWFKLDDIEILERIKLGNDQEE